ncbi:MAG: hypothetical protein ACKPE1_05705, partial [Dolichospermum sp.]
VSMYFTMIKASVFTKVESNVSFYHGKVHTYLPNAVARRLSISLNTEGGAPPPKCKVVLPVDNGA